ncbi:hypothetical protein ACLQ3K_26240 [Tsukamurella sp. DT100]|uniref:hypothetical protein n=1 Tax=Tsukamurella sp. DT100 TaxID=3393415 RepID=UPI003CEC3DAB
MNMARRFELPAGDEEALLTRAQMFVKFDPRLRKRAHQLRLECADQRQWNRFADDLLAICTPGRFGPDSDTRRAYERGVQAERRYTYGALALASGAVIVMWAGGHAGWRWPVAGVLVGLGAIVMVVAHVSARDGNAGLSVESNARWRSRVRAAVEGTASTAPAHLPAGWSTAPDLASDVAHTLAARPRLQTRQQRSTILLPVLAKAFPGTGLNMTYRYLSRRAHARCVVAALAIVTVLLVGLQFTALGDLPAPAMVALVGTMGAAMAAALSPVFEHFCMARLASIELSATDRARWDSLVQAATETHAA